MFWRKEEAIWGVAVVLLSCCVVCPLPPTRQRHPSTDHFSQNDNERPIFPRLNTLQLDDHQQPPSPSLSAFLPPASTRGRQPSSPHQEEAERQFLDLPDTVLSRLLEPDTELSHKDAASLFSTSHSLHALRSTVPESVLFYLNFAVPHLRLKYSDSVRRVGQALYQCGRLSPAAKRALVQSGLITSSDNRHSVPDYISPCATHFMAMVAAGIFPQAKPILPVAYRIQFAYQIMEVEGALEKVLPVLQFKSPTILQSLQYEHTCIRMFDTLSLLNEEDSDFDSYFSHQSIGQPSKPLAAAGCLILFRQGKIRQFAYDDPAFYQGLDQKLSRLDKKYVNGLVQYRELLANFWQEKPTSFSSLSQITSPERIADFVAHGLILGTVLPISDYAYPYVKAMIQFIGTHFPLMDSLAASGFNLRPAALGNLDILHYSRQQYEMNTSPVSEWLLHHGWDLESRDSSDCTHLLQATLDWCLDRYGFTDDELKNLVDSGADILASDENGVSAVEFLSTFSVHPRQINMVVYFLAHGRANLNERDWMTGESLLFRLVRASRVPLAVFQLVVAHGADVSVVNRNGVNASTIARTLGQGPLADWLDSLS